MYLGPGGNGKHFYTDFLDSRKFWEFNISSTYISKMV